MGKISTNNIWVLVLGVFSALVLGVACDGPADGNTVVTNESPAAASPDGPHNMTRRDLFLPIDGLSMGFGNGLFGEWNPWDLCSVSCGSGGTRTRSRLCLTENCFGMTLELESCSEHVCRESDPDKIIEDEVALQSQVKTILARGTNVTLGINVTTPATDENQWGSWGRCLFTSVGNIRSRFCQSPFCNPNTFQTESCPHFRKAGIVWVIFLLALFVVVSCSIFRKANTNLFRDPFGCEDERSDAELRYFREGLRDEGTIYQPIIPLPPPYIEEHINHNHRQHEQQQQQQQQPSNSSYIPSHSPPPYSMTRNNSLPHIGKRIPFFAKMFHNTRFWNSNPRSTIGQNYRLTPYLANQQVPLFTMVSPPPSYSEHTHIIASGLALQNRNGTPLDPTTAIELTPINRIVMQDRTVIQSDPVTSTRLSADTVMSTDGLDFVERTGIRADHVTGVSESIPAVVISPRRTTLSSSESSAILRPSPDESANTVVAEGSSKYS